MLETTPDVDRLILLSGDGEFYILLQKIKTKGKKVDVYGVP